MIRLLEGIGTVAMILAASVLIAAEKATRAGRWNGPRRICTSISAS